MLLASLYVLFAPTGGGPSLFAGSDKVVHVLLFALLAGTTRWRFGPVGAGLAALAAYAVGTEIVQGTLLATRSGDPYDVAADLLGVVAGWLVASRVLAR